MISQVMMLLHWYGNSDLDEKCTLHMKLWSMPSKSVDILLQYYVLVHCDLYLKLEAVTIEKSDKATLHGCSWRNTLLQCSNRIKPCYCLTMTCYN